MRIRAHVDGKSGKEGYDKNIEQGTSLMAGGYSLRH